MRIFSHFLPPLTNVCGRVLAQALYSNANDFDLRKLLLLHDDNRRLRYYSFYFRLSFPGSHVSPHAASATLVWSIICRFNAFKRLIDREAITCERARVVLFDLLKRVTHVHHHLRKCKSLFAENDHICLFVHCCMIAELSYFLNHFLTSPPPPLNGLY